MQVYIFALSKNKNKKPNDFGQITSPQVRLRMSLGIMNSMY